MSSDKQKLEQFLSQNGFTKTGNKYLCKFHDDHKPSGNIYEKNGKWYYKCMACGQGGDVYNLMDKLFQKAKGASFKEEKNNNKPAKGSGVSQNATTSPHIYRLNATASPHICRLEEIKNGNQIYKYADPLTQKIELVVVRYNQKEGQKTFRQFVPKGDGFIAGGPDGRLPLYNRSRIQKAECVVVVEGEKCVHALYRVGIVATTKPCGGQAPEKADWTPIYGKEAILWPDNDEKGIKYMEDVKKLLLPHCKVKWIDPTRYKLPYKGDAYDWLYGNCITKVDGKSVFDKALAQLPLLEAVNCGDSTDVIQYFEDVISGKLVEIDWPHRLLTKLTSCFIPGSTTLFCGEGGAGKTFFLSETKSFWFEHKITWVEYALESTKNLHLVRALAMRVGDGQVAKMSWQKANPDLLREYYNKHKDWMDEFGSNIIVPKMGIGQKELAERIKKDAETKRMIIVDPISIANQDLHTNQWDSDREFVWKIEGIAKESGASIINVSHPRRKGAQPDLDNIKGSMAWPNHTHNVLWMEPIKKTKTEMTDLANPHFEETINRKLHVLKSRCGECYYSTVIGYWFDHPTLKFKEYGVIVK